MIPPIPIPPPSHEQTVEALAACGVERAGVHISYEEDLQSDVVTVADLGDTGDARFECVRTAVHPFYILEISRADQRAAYFAYADRATQHEWRAEAIAWLGTEHLSDRIPVYDPSQGLEPFARAVEAACSAPSESVLEAWSPTALTFRREFIDGDMAAGNGDRLTCVMNMIAASNAEEYDVRLVMIGNEAVGDGGP